MRKVIAFGAGSEFISNYAKFLSRHGFELDRYNKKDNPGVFSATPVVLLCGPPSGRQEDEGISRITSTDRRMPIVSIVSGGGPDKPHIKKIRDRAKYRLPEGFLKKDLLAAVKGCSEILEMGGNIERLKGELRVKGGELSYVLDIGKALVSSFDLPKVLKKIMERMSGMVHAGAWSFMIFHEGVNELVVEAAKGGTGGLRRRRYKLGDGIAGWAARDGKPKLVADVSKEKHYSKAVDRVPNVKTRSVMAVPITGHGRLMGVMELINKEGADGFNEDDLKLVGRMVDHTAIAIERAEMYQKMADLVITDDLTKLFNLRYLDRTLEVEIERAMRYGLAVSLIFMDIDFFKKVNDRYGHLVGSKLLVEVSQLLLKGLRRVDIVARYGGDEFVIVLPQTDVNAATMIAQRLRRSVEKHVFLKQDSLAVKLTASFGIACYPDHAATQEDLIRLADEAMYRVKYQTRNDVYVIGK